jgi:hypothetical protein
MGGAVYCFDKESHDGQRRPCLLRGHSCRLKRLAAISAVTLESRHSLVLQYLSRRAKELFAKVGDGMKG